LLGIVRVGLAPSTDPGEQQIVEERWVVHAIPGRKAVKRGGERCEYSRAKNLETDKRVSVSVPRLHAGVRRDRKAADDGPVAALQLIRRDELRGDGDKIRLEEWFATADVVQHASHRIHLREQVRHVAERERSVGERKPKDVSDVRFEKPSAHGV
jgi:hypothetical protein